MRCWILCWFGNAKQGGIALIQCGAQPAGRTWCWGGTRGPWSARCWSWCFCCRQPAWSCPGWMLRPLWSWCYTWRGGESRFPRCLNTNRGGARANKMILNKGWCKKTRGKRQREYCITGCERNGLRFGGSFNQVRHSDGSIGQSDQLVGGGAPARRAALELVVIYSGNRFL